MILLNSALAFGGLAFLIPIAIHLMNRSRFRTVEWGAMHLLESVIKVNHKRFQFDQLILLLVRCMIPLLLAFCIARPLLTGGSTMEGNAPVSMLILLDNSYSMDVKHANGSRYEKAIEAAKKLIAATPKGSEISIIQSGGLPVPLFDRPVFDQAAVIRKLDRSTAGMGATMIEDSMNEAISTLRLMSHARRELIVISDFQDTDWQSFQSTHAGSFAKQFASMPIPPGITFLQVGEPIDENISINSIESPNRAIGVGERMRFRVNLQNHGKNPVNNSKLVFKVDGRQRSISQFSIASNSTAQVLFTHQFESPGSHIVTVETQTDDPLRSD
ncbi:VWA domain-containing protein, partial [bacterium]|nr:VWA domain-containing protein [bacterium]